MRQPQPGHPADTRAGQDGDRSGRVRRATAADVDAILDLLTEYDVPREYFVPWYRADPTYRPEQSWLVEQAGRLVAHLRVYDRRVRAGGVVLRIAGVGNVITAPAYRGQGLAGRLLDAMLAAAHTEGYAYSLLWTHLPSLYARHGWAPLAEWRVRATLACPPHGGLTVAPAAQHDLPSVRHLYNAANASRSGPTVRTIRYWQGQRAWLRERPGDFLVARAADGAVSGYVRSRQGTAAAELLEIGSADPTDATMRALLGIAAGRQSGRLQGSLPPSLRGAIGAGEFDLTTETGLMGRVVNLAALRRAFAPVWRTRAAAAGYRDTAFAVQTAAGAADLRAGGTGARRPAGAALDEAQLAHLLFHGANQPAAAWLAGRPDEALLRALFPAQDFVIWPADAF